MNPETPKTELTEQEREILRMVRELNYGKVVITIKNGHPVHAEMQKSVPL